MTLWHDPCFCADEQKPDNKENVEFYSGDLAELINGKLKSNHKNIWMVGGAVLIKECIRLKLADDIVISILPIILGGGTLFFDYIGLELVLHLKDTTIFKNGMVELTYEVMK